MLDLDLNINSTVDCLFMLDLDLDRNSTVDCLFMLDLDLDRNSTVDCLFMLDLDLDRNSTVDCLFMLDVDLAKKSTLFSPSLKSITPGPFTVSLLYYTCSTLPKSREEELKKDSSSKFPVLIHFHFLKALFT